MGPEEYAVAWMEGRGMGEGAGRCIRKGFGAKGGEEAGADRVGTRWRLSGVSCGDMAGGCERRGVGDAGRACGGRGGARGSESAGRRSCSEGRS